MGRADDSTPPARRRHHHVRRGTWGETSTRDERVVIAVRYRPTDGGSIAFSVFDAELGKFERIASRTLRGYQVVGTPLAQNVFGMLDTLWLDDDRIAKLLILDCGTPPGEDSSGS